MRILVIANACNVLSREQFHSKTLCLLDNAIGELGPGHPFRKPRVVIQALGDSSLAAQSAALDHQHIKAVSSNVNGGSERCWTAAYDDKVIELAFRLRFQPEFACQLRVRWFNQH